MTKRCEILENRCYPRKPCAIRGENSPLLHKSAGIFSGGATNGQAIDFDGRDTDAYGHSLAIFAAGPDTLVQLQVISNHRNPRQHVGAVANQRRAFDGGGDLAIFDQVRFRGAENEFTVGDVHLTASEVDGVDAVLY